MFGHRHIHEALLGVQVHCWRRLHPAALSLTLSTITYCVQKYLQNVCRAETLFRISDRSHWRCVAREWVGGSWAGEETGDFQQLPRVEEDPGPRQEASRQSWLVAILDFLTSPFPFEHSWPTAACSNPGNNALL